MKIRLSLRQTIIAIVLLTVASSLIVSSLMMAHDIRQNEQATIQKTISSTAKIVAQDTLVRQTLENNKIPSKSNNLQSYTSKIQKDAHVDFVVVMNTAYSRFSHPNKQMIGKKFSNLKDAKKSAYGQIHYSRQVGVLGIGYRIFVPVYSLTTPHRQIGIVCVGMTQKKINAEIQRGERPILLGLLLGLVLGLISAWLLATYIKRTLLDMEPEQIATHLTELSIINESMSEGLVAVSQSRRVISINRMARKLFPEIEVGKKLSEEIQSLIFKNSNEENSGFISVNGKELVVSTNALIMNGKQLGYMALLKDQTDFQRMGDRLVGANTYIDMLRAQTHDFMNKMQAISGLIELKQYEHLEKYVLLTKKNYLKEFGQINQNIQAPAIVGFLFGKIKQAQEQNIVLRLSENNLLPKEIVDEYLADDLIKIIGNLIDNAIDAIKQHSTNSGLIEIAINYDIESRTIVLIISDNGGGISDTVKRQMLEKHFSTKGTNRGYGLSLVKQILDRREGFIDISSSSLGGATFYLELPLDGVHND